MLAPIISDARFYLFAIPAVIFLGLAKGGFSGAATAATPLLALYLPPLEAAALLLPLVLCQCLDAQGTCHETRRHRIERAVLGHHVRVCLVCQPGRRTAVSGLHTAA